MPDLDAALREAVAQALRAELPAALRQALAEVQPTEPADPEPQLGPRDLAALFGCSLSRARALMAPGGPLAPFVAALPSSGSGRRRQWRVARGAALRWLATQRGQV